jgi:ABC-type cobalamin/Fe3+-siderophores transport systems, ATPase components
MTPKVPAYCVRELGYRYGTRHREPVREGEWSLRNVSFEVRDGEILGLLGPNGSGKTSLLKLLGKIMPPETGSIELFGSDVTAMRQDAVARLVAFVPQEHQQIFPFSIMETVLMGRFPHRARGRLAAFGWERESDLRMAQDAMKEMDVLHLADRSIHDVSSGERQRAIIARALAQQPRVLLLDEPTAFLDLNHQVEICRILRKLNDERGLAVVLVSHDLNMASQYCDRIMLMENGSLFQIGTPDAVITPEALSAVYRCDVLVDRHPISGLPRVTLPGRH